MKLFATIFIATATLVATPLATQASSFSTGLSAPILAVQTQSADIDAGVQEVRFRGRRGFRSSRGFRGRGFRSSRGFRSRGFRSRRGFRTSRGFGHHRGFKKFGHHGFRSFGFRGGYGGFHH